MIFISEYITAEVPEARATLIAPPSKAVSLASNAPTVGFPNLEYIFPNSFKPNKFAACSVLLN